MTRIPPIIQRAKQGDSHAIATLINRHLQVQGVTAKTKLKGDCLRLMLEGNSVPNQEAMVQFVYQGMTKLAAQSIKTVKIYGKQTHLDFPAWSQELNLDEQPQPILNQFLQNEASQLIPTQPQPDFKSPLVTAEVFISPEDYSHETSPNSSPKSRKNTVVNRLGCLVIASLVFRISFDSLFVIYAAVWATSYYIYDLFYVADTTGILTYLIHRLVIIIDSFYDPLEFIVDWTYTIVFVLILVWLHRVHAYLRTTEPDYPITPWGAVARFVIPFYSLWGMWNTLNTLAKRFKSRGGTVGNRGASLIWWIPLFYFTWIGSNLLDRIYWYGVRNAGSEDFSPWLFLIKNSAYLFFSLVWLQIVRIINQAITQEKLIINPFF